MEMSRFLEAFVEVRTMNIIAIMFATKNAHPVYLSVPRDVVRESIYLQGNCVENPKAVARPSAKEMTRRTAYHQSGHSLYFFINLM
jgi:hypothetical protein